LPDDSLRQAQGKLSGKKPHALRAKILKQFSGAYRVTHPNPPRAATAVFASAASLDVIERIAEAKDPRLSVFVERTS
jgi:hypothetical protein